MPPNAIAVRPPVPYFGGKQTIADWIAGHFPAHGHYVEPFGGGLSVLLAKPPSRMETVNDLDGELMTWWRVLRDRPAELGSTRACNYQHEMCTDTEHHEIAEALWPDRGLVAYTRGWMPIEPPR